MSDRTRPQSFPAQSLLSLALLSAALLVTSPAFAAPDEGKRACLSDAKLLCPNEMRSFSRKKVQACLIAKINQTTPGCHATMLKLKAEHDAAVAVKP